MKLSSKQKDIIDLIKSNSFKKDDRGYYYFVPTSVRRSGIMKVSQKEVNNVIKIINKQNSKTA